MITPEQREARKKYYHGGIPGLKIGEYILPPKETNTEYTLMEYAEEYCKENNKPFVQKECLVYLTSDLDAAMFFASYYPGGGMVYEVEPEGLIEHDEDCTTIGFSFQCPRAKIKKIL